MITRQGIHGLDGNPLTPIAQETGAIFYDMDVTAIYQDGKWLSSQEAGAACDKTWALSKQAIAYSKKHRGDIPQDKSLYDFVKETVQSDPDLSPVERDRIVKLSAFYTNISAADVSKQSLRNYWLEEELPGDHPLLASTYHKIIDAIARPSLHAIRYNTVVRSMTNKQDGTIIVEANAADEALASYAADAVIVTVPLGVLKARSIDFSPPLPQPLLSAIDSLGFGTAEKLFVAFNAPFWLSPLDPNIDPSISQYPKSAGYYVFLPHLKEMQNSNDTEDDPDLFISFISIAQFPVNAQPVLLVYSADKLARYIADLYKNKGKDGICRWLQKYVSRLPGHAPTVDCAIKDVQLTHWTTDPFSYGSYTYAPTGAEDSGRDIEILGKGLPERAIYFAGEHAGNSTNMGCVHGALLSADSAVRNLLYRLEHQANGVSTP